MNWSPFEMLNSRLKRKHDSNNEMNSIPHRSEILNRKLSLGSALHELICQGILHDSLCASSLLNMLNKHWNVLAFGITINWLIIFSFVLLCCFGASCKTVVHMNVLNIGKDFLIISQTFTSIYQQIRLLEINDAIHHL